MNNELFEKTKENVRKHRDSKFAINEAKIWYQNYHTRNYFSENY